MVNYYKVLGIKLEAGNSEIEKAYGVLCQQFPSGQVPSGEQVRLRDDQKAMLVAAYG